MKVTEHSLKLRGGGMPYIRFGAGKRIFVMISGMSTTGLKGIAEAVANAYSAFAEEYTAYLFDRIDPLPNGYTVRDMADDVACAMNLMQLKDADVMGFSQGGMIAQFLAIDHPELVHALALCSTCCRQDEAGRRCFDQWASLARAGDGVGMYRDFFDRVYAHPNRELLKAIENTATDAQCRRFGILAQACLEFDASAELHKIKCPVFVIGSERDRVIGADASYALARKLGCEIFMYSAYGHAVCDEAPDYKERLLAFFRKCR